MDRRAFISGITFGLLAAPSAARAQVIATVPRIGVLAVVPRSAPGIRAFEDRLQHLGYVDGRTIRIEFKAAADHLERLPALAMELAQRDVALFVAGGAEPAARALQQAAGARPVVLVAIDYDPVALGYVASLARPAGNMTGVSLQQIELSWKRAELLREALPRASRVGILWEKEWRSGDEQGIGPLPDGASELHSPSYDLADAIRARRIRGQRHRHVRPRGGLCGQDPQGRQTRRPARRAAH